jgi:hypothetical protein
LACFIKIQENIMLFSAKAANETVKPTATTDTGKITLGGGYRPATTADAGKIKLGGGYRPATTGDAGKIVLGGGYRLPTV